MFDDLRPDMLDMYADINALGGKLEVLSDDRYIGHQMCLELERRGMIERFKVHQRSIQWKAVRRDDEGSAQR